MRFAKQVGDYCELDAVSDEYQTVTSYRPVKLHKNADFVANLSTLTHSCRQPIERSKRLVPVEKSKNEDRTNRRTGDNASHEFRRWLRCVKHANGRLGSRTSDEDVDNDDGGRVSSEEFSDSAANDEGDNIDDDSDTRNASCSALAHRMHARKKSTQYELNKYTYYYCGCVCLRQFIYPTDLDRRLQHLLGKQFLSNVRPSGELDSRRQALLELSNEPCARNKRCRAHSNVTVINACSCHCMAWLNKALLHRHLYTRQHVIKYD